MKASAVINAHREGTLLAPTLRSLISAKKYAQIHGHEIEFVLVLDNPDRKTEIVVDHFRQELTSILQVSFRDLGASREFGIKKYPIKLRFSPRRRRFIQYELV